MKFNLKTDNYRQFSVYRKNLLKPRSYFIPFNGRKALDKTDILTERYHSPMVAVLSGEWKFKYYENCHSLPAELETDDYPFDTVQVPSMWQYTGYEEPCYTNTRYPFKVDPPHFPTDCPAAVYVKSFKLADMGGHYTLTFLGVAGSLDVFVNGSFVGYSEGSHNTSEFDVTELLNPGLNEIAVVVHKWSNGTYLEAQDMFRSNGIFRDVLLTRTEDNSIYDFAVKTQFSRDVQAYKVTILPTLRLADDCVLTAELFDGEELVSSRSIEVGKNKMDVTIDFAHIDAKPWSAETPNLYTLYLTLVQDGKVIEVVRRYVGFRHVEVKDDVFFFNDKRIKLLGVNHHDTTPDKGYCMTPQEMQRDVELVKQFNGNAVRTSHYPPDPIFLDLCDQYGIYVVDEADIETHGTCDGLYRPNLISNDLKWKDHYWDRVYRMFERDKNHACVTMWSLGNEAGGIRCQDHCYQQLKKLTEIPIHYEGAVRTKRIGYDVNSMMYPPVQQVAKIGEHAIGKYRSRPLFLCEYAHAMGVGAGDLEEYVRLFYAHDNLMGGCIWEFADHAVYHADGEVKYTYGGDHGETKHDSNFCVDGLFAPDRTPHPGAWQMKNCYRPVRAKKESDGIYSFFNHHYFAPVELTVAYTLLKDGVPAENGSVQLALQPQTAQKVELPIQADSTCHTAVVFQYMDGEREVAFEQFVLHAGQLPFATPVCKAPKLAVVSDNMRHEDDQITAENTRMLFNTDTGRITSWLYKGRELVNQTPAYYEKGINPELFRAPLDNDMYLAANWRKYGLEDVRAYLRKSRKKTTERSVVFTNKYLLSTPRQKYLGDLTMVYEVFGNGQVRVDVSFDYLTKINKIPRYGVVLELPQAFEQVRYFGLGEQENLSDFKEQAAFGVYDTTVSAMHYPYINPQESGMHCETRWAELTAPDGTGVRIRAVDKPFVFSAHHYTPQDAAKAAHLEELERRRTTAVFIDGYMLGAGSNACGTIPADAHRIDSGKKKFAFSFVIEPFDTSEQADA